MIVHVHSDGSMGYEYEPGDRVLVRKTVHGGWFDYGPTHSNNCRVIGPEPYAAKTGQSWRTAFLEVRHSSDWGPARCAPWDLEPHAETIRTAKIAFA